MNRTFLIVLLVLGSGAGLLAAGLVSLGEAVRAAELRAESDARQDAMAVARQVRRAVGDVSILDRLPAVARFAVAGGALVVPREVGWLREPAVRDGGMAAAAWQVEQLIGRAEAIEFGAGDAVAAARHYDEALVVAATAGARDSVLLRSGWQAWRADARELAAQRLEEVAERVEEMPPRQLASALLLHVAVRERLPGWGAARIGVVPQDVAQPLLARLVEQGLVEQDVDVVELRQSLQRAALARETLRAAEPYVGQLLGGEQPVVLPQGSEWVLFFGEDRESGVGALASAEEIVAVLQAEPASPLAPGAPAARFALGREISDDAVPVYPGVLAVVPVVISGAPPWLRPWTLSALLLVLAVCFALGLLLTFRVLRREHLATAARAEFLTSVTHELKTPLASIRLFAEMLDAGRVADETKRREYYRMLATESVRLTVLIENVLDLGRMERGERGYDLRADAPAEVLSEAAELFAPVGQRDGLEITVALDGVPATATMDRGAVVQALLNVMDNARKYATEGGVLTMEGRTDGSRYHILVRDRGPGIAERERAEIFERFRRGNRQADGSTPGVGLGLYLARSIMRAHGGDLTCEAPGDGGPGTCFHFTLPLEVAAA